MMRFISRIFAWLAPGLHWRTTTCPTTIDDIADDFVKNHVSPIPDTKRLADIEQYGIVFAWRRRICAIYGIATCFHTPRGEVAKRGWNKRVWSSVDDCSPEALVDQVFATVISRIETTGGRHSG